MNLLGLLVCYTGAVLVNANPYNLDIITLPADQLNDIVGFIFSEGDPWSSLGDDNGKCRMTNNPPSAEHMWHFTWDSRGAYSLELNTDRKRKYAVSQIPHAEECTTAGTDFNLWKFIPTGNQPTSAPNDGHYYIVNYKSGNYLYQPITPGPLQNKGKDCWYDCGNSGGICSSYCGTGNACCRKGVTYDPIECDGAPSTDSSRHTCVTPLGWWIHYGAFTDHQRAIFTIRNPYKTPSINWQLQQELGPGNYDVSIDYGFSDTTTSSKLTQTTATTSLALSITTSIEAQAKAAGMTPNGVALGGLVTLSASATAEMSATFKKFVQSEWKNVENKNGRRQISYNIDVPAGSRTCFYAVMISAQEGAGSWQTSFDMIFNWLKVEYCDGVPELDIHEDPNGILWPVKPPRAVNGATYFGTVGMCDTRAGGGAGGFIRNSYNSPYTNKSGDTGKDYNLADIVENCYKDANEWNTNNSSPVIVGFSVTIEEGKPWKCMLHPDAAATTEPAPSPYGMADVARNDAWDVQTRGGYGKIRATDYDIDKIGKWLCYTMDDFNDCDLNDDWDCCTATFPCRDGEGDCDSDSECLSGHCAHDVGQFYGTWGHFDVCEKNCDPSLEDWDCCSPSSPCADGQGDCDTDADCWSGYCDHDVGSTYGISPVFDVCVCNPGAGAIGRRMQQGKCVGGCIDSPTYVGPMNDTCADWTMDNCHMATSLTSAYTMADQNHLLNSCCLTCCKDDPSYVTELGDTCQDWAGYDCLLAESHYGMSSRGQQELLANCCGTCSWRAYKNGDGTGGGFGHLPAVLGAGSGAPKCHPLNFDWECCTPSSPCANGEGDCDSDVDCLSGYCGKNRGDYYGSSILLDVCEAQGTSPQPTGLPTSPPTIAGDTVSPTQAPTQAMYYTYNEVTNVYCSPKLATFNYKSVTAAKQACNQMSDCGGVYDVVCGGSAGIYLCRSSYSEMISAEGSCLHEKMLYMSGITVVRDAYCLEADSELRSLSWYATETECFKNCHGGCSGCVYNCAAARDYSLGWTPFTACTETASTCGSMIVYRQKTTPAPVHGASTPAPVVGASTPAPVRKTTPAPVTVPIATPSPTNGAFCSLFTKKFACKDFGCKWDASKRICTDFTVVTPCVTALTKHECKQESQHNLLQGQSGCKWMPGAKACVVTTRTPTAAPRTTSMQCKDVNKLYANGTRKSACDSLGSTCVYNQKKSKCERVRSVKGKCKTLSTEADCANRPECKVVKRKKTFARCVKA